MTEHVLESCSTTAETQDWVTLTGIGKSYAQKFALKNIGLSVKKNELLAILGPSGCGKSTLLNIIAGILQPDCGDIYYKNSKITSLRPEKRRFGMVFQNYGLFPNLTVFQNIGYGLDRKKKDYEGTVVEMARLVGLESYLEQYPVALSGGQQQRVALARALAPKPDVLLLDEPLSALDAKVRVELGREIASLRRQLNICVIMVTHDQQEAFSLADTILLLNNGRIEQIGSPHALYYEPESLFVADFIGHMNIVSIPEIEEGSRVGIRYEDVHITPASEDILSKPFCWVAKIEDIRILGAYHRVLLRLNDFKTQLYADVPNKEFLTNNFQAGNLVAASVLPKAWRKWR